MHRMTFPSTAQVSLDAAGVLTDRAAKMEGGGHPKIPMHGLLAPSTMHSSVREGEGVERVKMLSRGIYRNLAG